MSRRGNCRQLPGDTFRDLCIRLSSLPTSSDFLPHYEHVRNREMARESSALVSPWLTDSCSSAPDGTKNRAFDLATTPSACSRSSV